MRSFITHSVPVGGGMLRAIQWGPDPGSARETVVAVHGITASSRSMLALAEVIDPTVCLVAVDLRGRGDSNELPGPYGMEAHARDLAGLGEHLGVTEFVLLGHSMGAWVATTAAALYPSLVKGLVLLDGGMPLPIPAGIDPEIVIEAAVGPAIARLSMTFESMDAYFDFWKVHPSFADDWNEVAEEYFRYDVGGEPPAIRPRGNEPAIRADGRDLMVTHADGSIIRSLTQPIEFLRVDRGIMNDPPGFMPLEICEPVVSATGNLEMTSSSRFNHYTMLLTEEGAFLVNEILERLLARASGQ